MNKTGENIRSFLLRKKRLIKFVIIAAFIPLGIAIPILSYDSYNNTQTNAQTTTDIQARQNRIQEYKDNLQEEISSDRRQNIINKCDVSRERISAYATKVERIKNNRKARYEKISQRLDSIVEKIQNEDIDVVELQKLITEFNALEKTFNSDMDDFVLTIDDMKEIDCSTDPLAYAAALAEAKTQIAALKTQAGEIRTKLGEIKSQLVIFRGRLGN